MILLENTNYHKVKENLQKVTINNFFARSVIENKVKGYVYADNQEHPETFYIVHPYGMSLLFGNSNNNKFNSIFRDYALNINQTRTKHEWMQAFPNNWNTVLSELFKDCIIKSSDNPDNKEFGIIELNTRINFKFNHNRYKNYRNKFSISDLKIVKTNKKIFQEMKGSVVPYYFWNNADDFFENGIGFSLFYKNKLASTAYSSFIHDDKLELGIETVEEFRGKGFAQYVCSILIDYCIENNYEPIWACRLENRSSYNLALRLGFEPAIEIPYYKLSK